MRRKTKTAQPTPTQAGPPGPGRAIDVARLREFLISISSYTQDDLIYGPKHGESLYHYTDLNGLLGIVGSHQLWLTDARYSNDEEEMDYGYDTADKVIESLRLGADAQKVQYLDLVTNNLESSESESVFVCCFCTKGDLLSQWRSYAANGTGVSLEFNWDKFSWFTGPDSPHGGLMRLWKVFYDQIGRASCRERV